MSFRWKLSRTDTILLAALAALLAITFLVLRERADARLIKSTLENRARTAETNLAEAEKGADVAALTRALEQARASLTNPFPSEDKAAAFGVEIEESAASNKVSIIGWRNDYATAVFRNKQYPVIRHILTIEGSQESLLKFMEEVTGTSLAVSVESVTLSLQTPAVNKWHLDAELLVYYVQ